MSFFLTDAARKSDVDAIAGSVTAAAGEVDAVRVQLAADQAQALLDQSAQLSGIETSIRGAQNRDLSGLHHHVSNAQFRAQGAWDQSVENGANNFSDVSADTYIYGQTEDWLVDPALNTSGCRIKYLATTSRDIMLFDNRPAIRTLQSERYTPTRILHGFDTNADLAVSQLVYMRNIFIPAGWGCLVYAHRWNAGGGFLFSDYINALLRYE